MIKQKAVTHEQMLQAVKNKKIIDYRCKPLHPCGESSLERVQRQIMLHLLGY